METPRPAVTSSAPTLFVTCGLPGSGKTTLARQLEQDVPALRLTADEWLHALDPEITTEEGETGPLRGRVERLQWEIALRALELGTHVVLDWGVWAREERDAIRDGARSTGAKVVLCLLDPPIEVLWERLSRRNAHRPAGAFDIPKASLVKWETLFQRPSTAEMALFDPWEDGPPRGLRLEDDDVRFSDLR